LTVVEVVLGLTVTAVAALVLPLWAESPVYVPVMLAVPTVEGVNVKVHVAIPVVVPAARVQVVKVPVTPPTVNVTLPVGKLTVPVAVSVTVAVQVEPWLTTTGLEQVTLVVVVSGDGALTANGTLIV
jgi:hypothetical protein